MIKYGMFTNVKYINYFLNIWNIYKFEINHVIKTENNGYKESSYSSLNCKIDINVGKKNHVNFLKIYNL